MAATWKISEGDVLAATTHFFIQERKVFQYRFSVASGKDVDHSSIKAGIRKQYGSTGLGPEFSRHGPDIEAVSEMNGGALNARGREQGSPQRNETISTGPWQAPSRIMKIIRKLPSGGRKMRRCFSVSRCQPRHNICRNWSAASGLRCADI